MRIVHLSTEFAPIAKAGGLGDVLTGLARELSSVGHTVEVILPKYDFIPTSSLSSLQKESPHFLCQEKGIDQKNAMWSALVEGCRLLLLETHHPKGYFLRGKIYGCEDDTARFLYFSKACIEYLKAKNQPIDVLHLHDWPVSIAAVLAKEMYKLAIGTVVLTIHNAEYQGHCATWDLDAIGLSGTQYLTKDRLQDNHYHNAINLLKGAVVYADVVNTVSLTYAKEILTPEIGRHLSETFRLHKHKIHGIINGIDYQLWNPNQDRYLKTAYSSSSPTNSIEKGKESAKNLLRQHFDLTLSSRPWVGAIARIVPQKGPELLEEGLLKTIEMGGSFVLLGASPIPALQEHFDYLKKKYAKNKNVLLHFEYNELLAHQIYAGLDLILVPSHFEPCGLSQMIAMHYGTVPIVRATGGLQDTVFDCENSEITAEKRNGFVFRHATKTDLSHTLLRAFDLFRKGPETFQILIKRGMQQDFSWKKPAQEYLKLYTETT